MIKHIGITFSIPPKNIEKIDNIIIKPLDNSKLDYINKMIVFSNGFLYNAISLYNQFAIMNQSNIYKNNPIFLMDLNTYLLLKKIRTSLEIYNKKNSNRLDKKHFIFDFFNIHFELFNEEIIRKIDFLIELDRINHNTLDFKDVKNINPNIKIIAYKIINEYTLLNNDFVLNTKLKNSHSYEVFYYKNKYDHIIETNNHHSDCYLLYQTMFKLDNDNKHGNSNINLVYDSRILDFFDNKRLINKEELNIAICESNITYGKTFLNSLLLAEQLYRKIKQEKLNIEINQIYLFNCEYIKNNQSFINILHELTLFKDNKIKIENKYYYFIDMVKKYDINTVISLNQNNDMNYLYFDCFQYEINLIHNSNTLHQIINGHNLTNMFFYNPDCPNVSISNIVSNLLNINNNNYKAICKTCLDNVSIFNQDNNKLLKNILEHV